MELTKSRTITHTASVDLDPDAVDEAVKLYAKTMHKELKSYELTTTWRRNIDETLAVTVTGTRVVGSAGDE